MWRSVWSSTWAKEIFPATSGKRLTSWNICFSWGHPNTLKPNSKASSRITVGYWNGFTSATETVYQIDIFDKYLPLAIDTLHEILTDTIITPQKIESARAIIHREHSGNHSRLFRWLYENGIGKPAVAKAGELLLPGVLCPGLVTPDGISEVDVSETYK